MFFINLVSNDLTEGFIPYRLLEEETSSISTANSTPITFRVTAVNAFFSLFPCKRGPDTVNIGD